MIGNKKRNVLLEYFEKGNHFHYNIEELLASDECYRPLGWRSLQEADVFCHIMQPLLADYGKNEVLVTYERMKRAWGVFCEKVVNGKIIVNG